uniref:Uncharacterized protein n=1 Tax=Oryza sativa subsp. japonica TaxID=39947 RepID=Q5VQB3_ORYSJ|nr:hypothetical protein [Oryza sativa Japonica Group]
MPFAAITTCLDRGTELGHSRESAFHLLACFTPALLASRDCFTASVRSLRSLISDDAGKDYDAGHAHGRHRLYLFRS